MLVGGRDIGGWRSTISIGAIVVGMIDAFMYALDKICTEEKVRKDV